jgi:protein-arginine kinase activator protein McsA
MTPEEQKLTRKLRETRIQRDKATGRVRELRDYCTKYQRQIIALQAQLRQQIEEAQHDKATQS